MMSSGTCIESLAMKVALDNRVPAQIVTRAQVILERLLKKQPRREDSSSLAGSGASQSETQVWFSGDLL